MKRIGDRYLGDGVIVAYLEGRPPLHRSRVDALAEATGCSGAEVEMACYALERDGSLVKGPGGWVTNDQKARQWQLRRKT